MSDDITNQQLLDALSEQLGVITDNMATKDDVKQIVSERTAGFVTQNSLRKELRTFATKNDLRIFASKNDLKAFATKDDLKNFATRSDLKNFATKDDLKNFATRSDLKNFATKDDLKNFATKSDLKAFATKDNVREIVHQETATIRNEQRKQGVLLETLDHNVKAIAESVSSELELKERVNRHDERITALESKGKIVIATVTHHSKQIKTLQAKES